jgi:hypothetical protein
LKQELFDNGGATIETPPDRRSDEPIVARTVVQPDGDVLSIVVETGYLDDDDARAIHDEAVASWMAEFADTIATLRAALRRVGAAVLMALTVVLATAAGQGFGLVLSAGATVAAVASTAAGRRVGRWAAERRLPGDAEVLGLVARLAVLAIAAVVAVIISLALGRAGDLARVAAVVALLVPTLGVFLRSVVQVGLRRWLGFRLVAPSP